MTPIAERLLSPDDPRVEPYRQLQQDREIRRHGFVVEGMTTLERALGCSLYPLISVLASERRLGRVQAMLAGRPTVPRLYVASQPVLDAICGFPVHRGVLAYGSAPVVPAAEDLLASLPERAVVLCAIGVGDPENMGALFRNAAALGASAVLPDGGCCDPFYRRAIRVSVGATLTLASARLAPQADVVGTLRRCNFAPVALSPIGGTPLRDLRRPARAALLVGAEGPGLPPDILARALTVRIPMAAGFDSLNVAAASAIALHHLLAQEPGRGSDAVEEV